MSQKKADSERLRDVAPLGLRMPPDLKGRIKSAAMRNGRSMNAEIVAALEEKYPATVGISELIEQIQNTLDEANYARLTDSQQDALDKSIKYLRAMLEAAEAGK
jgi:SUMO ligase MMS21 Smc5/6 complex component